MSRKPAEAASKEPNEFIPQFISKRPFYIDDDTASDYLQHQRLQKAATDQSKWYERGKRLGPAATKFRKGACENCGAMSHKTKDCLSRPRARGARWTGKDIQADEVVQDVELGWDAKRDRWNGYDATEYRAVIEEYEEMENLKKKVKLEDRTGQKRLTEGGEEIDGREEEEAKYAEESDMGRHQSTATRNLRLREDTAKYLVNLDLESARYDPKTRSMVDMGAQADQAAALVAQDNFMRASGDAQAFQSAQRYAWESQERGDKNKTHVQANPTSGEYFLRKEKEEREKKQEAHKKMLHEKYGGEQYLHPSSLHNVAVLENERYVEYDGSGAIRGAPKAVTKSKYPEDMFINNHTSVWGSWWKDFQWGFACCRSIIKNSYCTGEEGRKAFEDADNIRTGGELGALDNKETTKWAEKPVERELDRQGLVTAMQRQKAGDLEERRLTGSQGGVSEKEMEAYMRTKAVPDDPMAKFLGKDEFVH